MNKPISAVITLAGDLVTITTTVKDAEEAAQISTAMLHKTVTLAHQTSEGKTIALLILHFST